MGARRTDKELEPFEVFERALLEEMKVSEEFGLPLALLVVATESEGSANRAAGALRVADLIGRFGSSEVVVVLPNTGPKDARIVEGRLREALPDARIGVAAFSLGDGTPELLARARGALPEGS